MKQFEDVGEFIAFMRGMPAKLVVAAEIGLSNAAKVIQEESKAEIGHYQAAAGPFAGWPELSEATQTERERLGYSANDPLLRSGELRNAVEMSVGEHQAAVGVPHREVGDGTKASPERDIGQIAIWMEEGTEKAPPRSFLGHAAFVKSHQAVDAAAGAVAATIAGLHPKRHASAREGLTDDFLADIPF